MHVAQPFQQEMPCCLDTWREQKYSLVMNPGNQDVNCVYQSCFKEQEWTPYKCYIYNEQSLGDVKKANVKLAQRTSHDEVSEIWHEKLSAGNILH